MGKTAADKAKELNNESSLDTVLAVLDDLKTEKSKLLSRQTEISLKSLEEGTPTDIANREAESRNIDAAVRQIDVLSKKAERQRIISGGQWAQNNAETVVRRYGKSLAKADEKYRELIDLLEGECSDDFYQLEKLLSMSSEANACIEVPNKLLDGIDASLASVGVLDSHDDIAPLSGGQIAIRRLR